MHGAVLGAIFLQPVQALSSGENVVRAGQHDGTNRIVALGCGQRFDRGGIDVGMQGISGARIGDRQNQRCIATRCLEFSGHG